MIWQKRHKEGIRRRRRLRRQGRGSKRPYQAYALETMTINKRKKNTRQRGKTTHGWGARKKHRGAGNRGGRGMAGSGKRADQKKPSILKEYGNTYFGKFGFKIPQKIKKQIKEINISTIE